MLRSWLRHRVVSGVVLCAVMGARVGHAEEPARAAAGVAEVATSPVTVDPPSNTTPSTSVRVAPEPSRSMPTPSSIPTARAPSADAGAPLWVPVSVGLVGLAGVAVGITAALLALEEKGYAEDHCSPTQRLCDPVGAQATRNGRMFSMVSASTLGLGALAVVGAVAIYRSSDSRTQIAGSVTPLGGGQLRFTHRW